MSKPQNDNAMHPYRPAMEWHDEVLRLWAPAKINLNLLVGTRRADGFHALDSFVSKITLYDQIDLTRRRDSEIVFTCAGADCGLDEKNLAYRAAILLSQLADESADISGGVDIKLTKQIPPGKGLGGGSSDAAAVLHGLNELWRIGLSRAKLAELSQQLGSDVPLFLGPACARMTGRGEHIEAIAVHPFAAVLFLPDQATSTAEVYTAFDTLAGEAVAVGGRIVKAKGKLGGMQLDLELLQDPPSRWRDMLRNDLTEAAWRVCPELSDIAGRLAKSADAPVSLTGSGSAMFVLCDSPDDAQAIIAKLPKNLADQCVVVRQSEW